MRLFSTYVPCPIKVIGLMCILLCVEHRFEPDGTLKDCLVEIIRVEPVNNGYKGLVKLPLCRDDSLHCIV